MRRYARIVFAVQREGWAKEQWPNLLACQLSASFFEGKEGEKGRNGPFLHNESRRVGAECGGHLFGGGEGGDGVGSLGEEEDWVAEGEGGRMISRGLRGKRGKGKTYLVFLSPAATDQGPL